MTGPRAAALPAYVAVVAAVGLATAALAATAVAGAPTRLTWPVLAAAFAASELGAIHVRFRREAFSFTLHEAVLVVAVLTLAPREAFVALVVGCGSVMAGVQRLRPVKVIFNLGQYLLTTSVMVAVLGSRSADVLAGPAGWALVFVTSCSLGVCTLLLIAVAIRLADGTPLSRTLRRTVGRSLLATVVATSLGLGVAALALGSPRHLWLLLAPTVLLGLSARAHHRLVLHAEQLELIHEAVRSGTVAGDAGDESPDVGEQALLGLLERSLELIPSERLILVRSDQGRPVGRVELDADGRPDTRGPAAGDADLLAMLRAAGGSARIESGSNLLPGVFEPGRPAQALGVLLESGGRVHGALVLVQAIGTAPAGEQELRLLRSLAGHGALAVEAGRLAAANARLRAHGIDPVLGMPTMSGIDDALTAGTGPVALVWCALTGLDEVTDLHGFDVGDEVLAAVATRLRNLVRPGDLVARIGAEQFALLVEQASDPFAVEAFGERVRQQLGVPFRLGSGETVQLGARVGIGFDEHRTDDARALLRAAREHDRRVRLRRHLGVADW